MKEFMPYTHADPATVRQYADRAASFDDIAEDRGPRLMTTFDVIDAVTFTQVARRASRQKYPPDEAYKYTGDDDES